MANATSTPARSPVQVARTLADVYGRDAAYNIAVERVVDREKSGADALFYRLVVSELGRQIDEANALEEFLLYVESQPCSVDFAGKAVSV